MDKETSQSVARLSVSRLNAALQVIEAGGQPWHGVAEVEASLQCALSGLRSSAFLSHCEGLEPEFPASILEIVRGALAARVESVLYQAGALVDGRVVEDWSRPEMREKLRRRLDVRVQVRRIPSWTNIHRRPPH